MNNKRAKALRKYAQQLAHQANLPDISYTSKKTDKIKTVIREGEAVQRTFTSVTLLLGECTRRVYKELKKASKIKQERNVN